MTCKSKSYHQRPFASGRGCGGCSSRRSCRPCGRRGRCHHWGCEQYSPNVMVGPTAIFDSEKLQTEYPIAPYFVREADQLPVSTGPAATPSLPLAIPSSSVHFTSGFPYTPALSQLDVSEEAWRAFTSELTKSAKLSFGQAAALVGSAAPLCVVGLWFHGTYMGSQLRHRSTIKNINDSYSKSEEGVAAVMARWNADFYGTRGLEARLVVPDGKVPLLPYTSGGRAWRSAGCNATRYAIIIANKGSVEEGELEPLRAPQEKAIATAKVEELEPGNVTPSGSPPPYAMDKKTEAGENVVHPLLR